MYYTNNEIKGLCQSREIAIFGAGAVAEAVVYCLTKKPYELFVKCCIVSDMNENPPYVLGIPVVDIFSAEKILLQDAIIVVAIAEKNLESIRDSLYQCKHKRMIFLTYESDLWSLIRGNYFREQRLRQNKSYLTLEEELKQIKVCQGQNQRKNQRTAAHIEKVRIYRVKSHFDKDLQNGFSHFPWELPIHAGAGLTDKYICDICDDTGDNISNKNRKYCELTALYWIWKNDRPECPESTYIGLSHYRRHFELNKQLLERLVNSDIDVVLTIPIFDYPDVETVYRRDHIGDDWDVMLEALRVLHPENMTAAEELKKGNFYYGYNMFIMRKNILDEYCTWLFPVLSYCEKHCEEKDDAYQKRYIGFLAEHLMTIYFLHHERDYKIVHTKKHFIEK